MTAPWPIVTVEPRGGAVAEDPAPETATVRLLGQ